MYSLTSAANLTTPGETIAARDGVATDGTQEASGNTGLPAEQEQATSDSAAGAADNHSDVSMTDAAADVVNGDATDPELDGDDPMDVDELSEGEAVAPVQGALVGNKQGKLSTSSCVRTVNDALAGSTAVGTKGKKVKKVKKATTGTASKAKSPYRYVCGYSSCLVTDDTMSSSAKAGRGPVEARVTRATAKAINQSSMYVWVSLMITHID